jgi:hypothetical protein
MNIELIDMLSNWYNIRKQNQMLVVLKTEFLFHKCKEIKGERMIKREDLLDRGLDLIPVNEITIELDKTKTVGYDFTVEDFYTFCTHDGVYVQDCMAIYFPITEASENDIRTKLGIWKNLISPTDLTLVPQPSQDIILGIWDSTRTKDTDQKIEYHGHMLSPGQILFNECLPDDYPIQTETFTGKKLKLLLNDIVFKYPAKVVMKSLDRLKKLGFEMTTLNGYTLALDDLWDEELYDIGQSLSGNKQEDFKIINSEHIKEKLNDLPFADIVNSGARGNWDQVKQLVMCRGYVSDYSGRIRDDVVKNSLLTGLTPEEYFNSCWGVRKGLLDTAMSTGDSGYLGRQLVYSSVGVVLDNECEDCGTTDTLEITVTKENIKVLLWRYHIEDNVVKKISRSNIKDLIGKTIKLRSPIYCQNTKVCKKCYGELHKILHSTEIGIIAAQAIGERSVQLILRSFHTSGVANTESLNINMNEDIGSSMALANKLFHSPNKILKDSERPESLVIALYELFNQYKKIHLIHYEVIVSSMMWYNDVLWRISENRNENKFKWTSILQTPSKLSWLLGMAFASLKNKLVDGLINSRIDVPNCLTDLFRYNEDNLKDPITLSCDSPKENPEE